MGLIIKNDKRKKQILKAWKTKTIYFNVKILIKDTFLFSYRTLYTDQSLIRKFFFNFFSGSNAPF